MIILELENRYYYQLQLGREYYQLMLKKPKKKGLGRFLPVSKFSKFKTCFCFFFRMFKYFTVTNFAVTDKFRSHHLLLTEEF